MGNGTPAAPMSTRRSTRSGWWAAIDRASAPPKLLPTMSGAMTVRCSARAGIVSRQFAHADTPGPGRCWVLPPFRTP